MYTTRTVVCAVRSLALLGALLATALPAIAQDNTAPRPESRHIMPVAASSAKISTRGISETRRERDRASQATDMDRQQESDRPPYVTYEGAENAPR